MGLAESNRVVVQALGAKSNQLQGFVHALQGTHKAQQAGPWQFIIMFVPGQGKKQICFACPLQHAQLVPRTERDIGHGQGALGQRALVDVCSGRAAICRKRVLTAALMRAFVDAIAGMMLFTTPMVSI